MSGLRLHGRVDALKFAREWIGTPYHHQASVKGVGCDCIGLVRGVYRDLYGFEPQKIPPYSRDWTEIGDRETLLEAGIRHFTKIKTPLPGDVVIFRFQKLSMAKHVAILADGGRMVHAVENAPVCEVHMGHWWMRRIAGTFRFPGCVE